MKKLLDEKDIHQIFDVSLVLKGLYSLFEIVGGFLILLVSQEFIFHFVLAITQEELSEDPRDFVANYLIRAARHFSLSAQHFIALYLLLHGIIKGILVIALLKKKLRAYPIAIGVFSLFCFYQIFEFAQTYSVWLLLLTLLDILIIALTWHEYGYVKKSAALDKGIGKGF